VHAACAPVSLDPAALLLPTDSDPAVAPAVAALVLAVLQASGAAVPVAVAQWAAAAPWGMLVAAVRGTAAAGDTLVAVAAVCAAVGSHGLLTAAAALLPVTAPILTECLATPSTAHDACASLSTLLERGARYRVARDDRA
jgi:hypothetical protein